MSHLADDLHRLYNYASTHQVVDFGLLLRAAAEIERLTAESEAWRRDFDERQRAAEEGS